ncbi:uncharacterized protein LOC124361437 [Homalodisca vitripennis]|uniref:uncharacterized protein LOC124361437 n=1 Tax=Homalodisca vitripennis TaxID=197043 RepID=UPI001EEA2BFD|nr:uncharacterized protein LOC124361437 [Homalodisca vitripennis]
MYVFLFLITMVGLVSAADDCFYTAVDLSYRLSPFSTNYYPNFLPFEITIELVNVITDILFNEAKYIAGDEGGTKVEVPARFCDKGYKVGELCKDQLFLLPACVIDLTEKAAMDDNYQATVQDVEQWQAVFGPFPPRSIVIFDFGWSPRYPDVDRFFGRRGRLGTQLNHPGICPDLADYLGRHCNVYAVGTDAPDVDCGRNNELTTSPSQRILASHGKYTVTQLQLRRRRLPTVGAVVTVAPFYMAQATAAPARVFAEFCADPVPEVDCPVPPPKPLLIEHATPTVVAAPAPGPAITPGTLNHIHQGPHGVNHPPHKIL